MNRDDLATVTITLDTPVTVCLCGCLLLQSGSGRLLGPGQRVRSAGAWSTMAFILRDSWRPTSESSQRAAKCRDRAHACQHIAKRGWSADQYLGMVLNMVTYKKTFITSETLIRNSSALNGSGSTLIRCLPIGECTHSKLVPGSTF